MEVPFAQTYFNTQSLHHVLNRVCYEENSSSLTLVDRDSSVSIMTRKSLIDREWPLHISAWSENFVLYTASKLLYCTNTLPPTRCQQTETNNKERPWGQVISQPRNTSSASGLKLQSASLYRPQLQRISVETDPLLNLMFMGPCIIFIVE